MPSFTFAATANSVALGPGRPRCSPTSSRSISGLIRSRCGGDHRPRPRRIMPVHLYGHPAALERWAGWRHAQDRLGLRGRCVGTWGQPDGTRPEHAGAWPSFSLYPTKNTTCREGGMVTTANAELNAVPPLAQSGHGQAVPQRIGGLQRARMTDIHAAIGRVQLPKLTGWTSRRRTKRRLPEAPCRRGDAPGTRRDPRLPPVHDPRSAGPRIAFAAALASVHGVGSGIYYPVPGAPPSVVPAHDGPSRRWKSGHARCCLLPVHPSLSGRDLAPIRQSGRSTRSPGAGALSALGRACSALA